MGGENFPQPYEDTHDRNVDLDGALAPEHARQLGRALLREEVNIIDVLADVIVVATPNLLANPHPGIRLHCACRAWSGRTAALFRTGAFTSKTISGEGKAAYGR